jgi:PhzF family phenazine biosynthesis protein
MAREVEYYHIDAFTNEEFKGNPAVVIFDNHLTDIEKLKISNELNLSETAFLSESKIADFKLQWFTTIDEVNLCGHATMAALHFLNEKGFFLKRKSVTLKTLSGIVNCITEDGKYVMQLPVPKLYEYYDFKDEILEALNLRSTSLANLPFLYFKDYYLFVHVSSLDMLWSLKPDYNKIRNLSALTKSFLDIAVFTTETVNNSSVAHLRVFTPAKGADEDPVTGSACGPLLLVLIKLGLIKKYKDNTYVTIEQGDFLDRNGRVGVKFISLKNELYIAGNCVTAMKGKIYI